VPAGGAGKNLSFPKGADLRIRSGTAAVDRYPEEEQLFWLAVD
jgi:hypothetical protein